MADFNISMNSADLENLKINTAVAKEQCDELLDNIGQIESVTDSIRYIAGTDLPNIWSNENADVNSIISKLNENVEFLEQLATVTREFAYAIRDYAIANENK